MNKKWLQIIGMIAILLAIFYMKFSLTGNQDSQFFQLFSPKQDAKNQ